MAFSQSCGPCFGSLVAAHLEIYARSIEWLADSRVYLVSLFISNRLNYSVHTVDNKPRSLRQHRCHTLPKFTSRPRPFIKGAPRPESNGGRVTSFNFVYTWNGGKNEEGLQRWVTGRKSGRPRQATEKRGTRLRSPADRKTALPVPVRESQTQNYGR